MKTEIISTGQEVISGAIVDTNAAYIAQAIIGAGGDIVRHTCVGDNREALVTAFTEAETRADYVIVTGGLGPTSDDLTAEAAAEAMNLELVIDPDATKSVTDYFRRKNMSVPESNRKQTYLPSGAECLANEVGTAPGFLIRRDNCIFFYIPGVPSEMRYMVATYILPVLEGIGKGRRIVHRVKTLSHFGIPEAEVNDLLSDIEEMFPEVTLGLQAVFPVIHAKLYASGSDEEEIDEMLDRASQWALERTGHAVFSTDGKTLPEVVGEQLMKHHRTVALAESCTGGLIGHMLTGVAGSSSYFLFSGVTYSNDAKKNVLGVKQETLDTYGAVSRETVCEMAEGTRRIAGADYGIAISGIAGPDGGTSDKPVGTFCIGIASDHDVKTYRFVARFSDREKNKKAFAMKALDILRRALMDQQ